MKKVIASLIVLVMLFALVACSGGGTTSPSSSPSTAASSGGESSPAAASGKPYPNANADGSINLETIAHFDPDYDYSQNERFKFTYIAQDGGPLYQDTADGFAHWAPLMNMEWMGFVSANGDTDLFMTQLQNAIDQGVTGIIVDPDATIMQAVMTLINRYPEVKWMTVMAPPRDGIEGDGIPVGGSLVTCYVGHDHYMAGVYQAEKLIEWKKETYPDLPWSDFGFLAMSFSVSPPLYVRTQGSRDVWVRETGSEEGFFEADTVSTGLNMQGGMDAAAPIISMNGQYKHWLVMGLIDDTAQGAAAILDQQGLSDGSCVVTFGGSGFVAQMDAGQHDAFRYALYTAQTLYTEPIIGSVYAQLNGWCTNETIWPQWVKDDDHGTAGHNYSQLHLPVIWLDSENYKHYLAWTDIYAKSNKYPNYPKDGIALDAYSPFEPVEKGFSGYKG